MVVSIVILQGAEEAFKKLSIAYTVLEQESERKEYDDHLKMGCSREEFEVALAQYMFDKLRMMREKVCFGGKKNKQKETKQQKNKKIFHMACSLISFAYTSRSLMP